MTMPISNELSQALSVLESAGKEYAAACAKELELEYYRPAIKHDAIARLMHETNDLTNRPHSCSSAEAIVEADEEYGQHLRDQRVALMAKIRAEAEYKAAQYRAQALAQQSPPMLPWPDLRIYGQAGEPQGDFR